MKHITTGLLLAAAISVCTPAQSAALEGIGDEFNRAYRAAAGLSTPQERHAERVEDLLEDQNRQLEEQRRQQEELRWEVYRLRQRLR